MLGLSCAVAIDAKKNNGINMNNVFIILFGNVIAKGNVNSMSEKSPFLQSIELLIRVGCHLVDELY